MIHYGLLGMTFEPDGLRLSPTLPGAWGKVALTGLSYRAARWDISLSGKGRRLVKVTLDGAPANAPFISCGHVGQHRLDLVLEE